MSFLENAKLIRGSAHLICCLRN